MLPSGVVLAFPGRRHHHRPADQARPHEDAMDDARTALIEAFRLWMLNARPSRDDADMEAEAAASVLRQLIILETRGGGAP